MHRHTKVASVAVCIATAAAIALPVAAQFRKPEDAVKYRQAVFVVMNNQMGRINAQLKSATPNMQVIQSGASVVEAVSKLPWDAFNQNTEFVTDTRALPALFKNEAKIKELADKMHEEAVKLNSVARTGDVKAVRTQFGVVAKTCDNCHDDYRAK
ncbi:MAG: cytochrome c [Burkholderiaceae bacterium]|nr:cytochrome c [Burkholderiaceae bacterium]